MSEFDVIAYLASKNLRGVTVAGGREMTYPCFLDCEEAADSRKRKLYVNPTEGLYHCKVCGSAGGAWTLQKHFGDEPRQGTNDDAWMRQRILDAATDIGVTVLNTNDDALLYLMTERGLSPETIVERKLGFIAGGWSLVGTLPEDITTAQVKTTGLVHREGPRAGRDFFYRHLLIPYLHHGHTLQMRGRAWGEISGGKYFTGPGEVPRVYNAGSLEGAEEVIITEGEFDCYSGDVEILTPHGWVRFDEYAGGPVAQVHRDQSLTFAAPEAIARKPEQRMIRLYTKRRGGVDLTVTPGHRMVSCRPDGSEVYLHGAQAGPRSTQHHLPRAGQMDGPGIPYSVDEISLLLALSADASVDECKLDGSQYARFGFAKPRKTQRLLDLMVRLGIEYSATINSADIMSVCFRVPNYLRFTRELPQSWLALATLAQRKHILSELIHWDGNYVHSRTQTEYSSKLLHNAEWVQQLAHTTGFVATIMARSNQFGSWYKVSLLHEKSSTSWQAIRIEEAPTQIAYCLQVPTGMLMVRSKGMVLVSGNCMILAQTLAASPEARARKIAVISLPGTSAVPEEFDAILTDAKRIFIGMDPDEPGAIAAVKLKDRIGPRARILTLPYADGRKDDWSEYLLPADGPGTWVTDHPYAGHTWRDVLRLLSSASGKRVFSVAEAGEAARNRMEQHGGIKTGYRFLDAAISPGLLPGQVVIMLAKTGAGKTVVLCNLSYNMRAHKILFVSLEMTREEVYERLKRIYLFHHPHASDEDIDDGLKNIYICDENRLGTRDLSVLAAEFAVEADGPPEVVLVDYLGYYARGHPGNSPYEKVGNAVMELKAEAKTGRFVVICPAQVNRGAKPGKPIDLDDARDAGQVEETADFLLALFRPDDALQLEETINPRPSGKVRLSLLKSRHGGVGAVYSLQMDLLSLVVVDDGSPEAKKAQDHNYMAWRGHDWAYLRHTETAPRQMPLEGVAHGHP